MKLNQIGKLQLEQQTYSSADKYIEGYNGGSWAYSRKGFYYPKDSKTVVLINPNNYFEAEVDALTCGYALAVLSCNRLCLNYHSKGNDRLTEFWSNYQYQIRDEALDNLSAEQASKFLSFID